MAVIQSFSVKGIATFGELSCTLSHSIINGFKLADIVAVVPDQYDVVQSIKSFERSRRTQSDCMERVITGRDMKVPSNFSRTLRWVPTPCIV